MSSSNPAPAKLTGPGFVVAILDIPFALALPNDAYLCHDPKKGTAFVETLQKEGSRGFFRNIPIQGPTSFGALKQASKDYERPTADYSYMAVANLSNGERKACLNIHTGTNGGFAEAKYYSEVHVTFVEDELGALSVNGYVMGRVAEILNPFLDKYRLLTQDYRVGHVANDRNFYVTLCHTSPLSPEEAGLSAHELLVGLTERPRTFYQQIGHGAMNVLRLNNLNYLLPRAQMDATGFSAFHSFLTQEYELPVSYDLILEALRSMQVRDFKLAIVHAATAVEAHVLHLLHGVLKLSGQSATDAWNLLENDPAYQGVKNRVKRLEEQTREYCTQNSLPFVAFLGGRLYQRWDANVCGKRNRAVHAGVSSFSFQDASDAIGIAKEAIVFLDTRIASQANIIQLDPSMAGYRESSGGVLF